MKKYVKFLFLFSMLFGVSCSAEDIQTVFPSVDFGSLNSSEIIELESWFDEVIKPSTSEDESMESSSEVVSSSSSQVQTKPKKKVKVYINPSVQIANLYTNNLGTEAEHMNDIAYLMKKELSTIEHIDLMCNLDYLSLSKSVAQSNSFGADIHLALHSNAGGGKGSEIFTTTSHQFASWIYDDFNTIGNFNKRGVKDGSKLYEVRNSKAKDKALLEMLFHDNLNEAKFIVNNKQKIADTLVDSILEYIDKFYLNIY